MARKPAPKAVTTLTPLHLQAQQENRPTSPQGHHSLPPRAPGFHTVVDFTTSPRQPWRDLPPPSGAPPFV
jgi:hypothetical protein